MSRLRISFLALATILCLLPAPAQAQNIQITPFAGGRFFGGISDYTGADVDVDDAFSYGGFLTVTQGPALSYELGYSHQDTDATLSRPFADRTTFDVKIDQWTFGVQRHFPRPGQALTPFGGGLVGLTHAYSSDGDGSQTKFMLGASGGAKVLRPESPLGLRLEARGYFTFAGDGGAAIGCGTGGCGFGFSSQAFFQLDLVAGVILNLGGRERR